MPARLVTIPISHFCEKARWALDRAGVDYVEQPHLQLIHVVVAKRAGGGRTVPVLVTEEGQVLADSTDILRWTDERVEPDRRLYPEGELGREAAELESWLDDGFGPDGRLWLYHETLPDAHALDEWVTAGIPRWEQRFFRMGGPTIEWAMRRFLHITADNSVASLARVNDVFDEIASRLSDGRRFILGDRFTAADLTFAALAAPMIDPARYGSPLPPIEKLPEGAAREIRRFRQHPAGVFADRLYTEERVHLAPAGA